MRIHDLHASRLVAALALLLMSQSDALAQVACSLSVTPLTFGAYTGAQVQTTGTVDLTCSGPAGSRPAYTITASPGVSGNYAQRFLQRAQTPAETLNYTLTIALGNNKSAIWGNGAGGTSAWSGQTQPINAGNAQRVASTTVTGTIAAGAVPSAGSYSDTIIVTATWN
jgi:spore coat protein U-like protein